MPVVVAVLIILSVVYQMFFRYDHWVDANNNGRVYERDNLTGEVYTVDANQKRSLMARVLGKVDAPQKKAQQNDEKSSRQLRPAYGLTLPVGQQDPQEAVALVAVDSDGQPVVGGVKTMAQSTDPTLASNATPLSKVPPVSRLAAKSVAIKSPEPQKVFDLNRDGQPEQLMMRSAANDGLLDISVLADQRELFYGRGKALQVLSTSKAGWHDVALVLADGKPMVFQFNPAHGGYEVKQ